MTEITIKDVGDRATILVASDDINVRPLFQNVGVKSLQVVRSHPSRIESVLNDPTTPIDILVIEDYLGGNLTSTFIREIRDKKIGKNPFIPIIAMLSENSPHMVERKMKSGVDDLLMKPLSSTAIQKRLVSLANRDLEWAVTKSYIGPNRRSLERTKKTDGLIAVPNILQVRALGNITELNRFSKSIETANALLKNRKLALEADAITEMLKQAYLNPVKFEDRIERVKLFAWDYAFRLRESTFKSVGELCHLMIMILNDTTELSMRGNHSILMLLGQAIELAFDDTPETQAHINQIIQMVEERFKKECKIDPSDLVFI